MPLRYFRRPLFLVLFLYILALSAFHAAGYFNPRPPAELLRYENGFLTISGVVVSPARHDHWGDKIEVLVRRFGAARAEQKVLVYLPKNFPRNDAVRPGQELEFSGRLRRPYGPRNPGDFDERKFLAERGIAWVFQAEDFSEPLGPVGLKWRPYFWAESIRRSIEKSFTRLLPPEPAQVLSGLVLGYKSNLNRKLNDAIVNAGVMHLLVPSGAKVALVILAVCSLALWMGLRREARFLAAALLGGFYTLMVGADPPYCRAYFSALAVYAGFLLDRDSGPFQAMTLSALLVLLLSPRALFSAGFQMTYLAVAGIVAAVPRLGEYWMGLGASWWGRMARALVMTITVEAMLWPMFADVFGRAAVVGALANLILIPFSGVLMAGGFLLWGLSWLPQPILRPLAVGVAWLVGLFCRICFCFSAMPWAAQELFPLSRPKLCAYYLVMAALIFGGSRRMRIILAGAAALCWAGGAAWARLRAPPLDAIYFWPARAGSALVFVHGQKVFLVGRPRPRGVILKAMKVRRVARLDKVILTDSSSAARAELEKLGPKIAGLVQQSRPPAWICEKNACLGFSPPRLKLAGREFDIIMPSLKRQSVEVITDGFSITIADGSGQTLYQLGGALLQRGQARGRAHDESGAGGAQKPGHPGLGGP